MEASVGSSGCPLVRTSYGLDVGGSQARTLCRGGPMYTYSSKSRASLEELLEEDFSKRGFTPEFAVLALPAAYQNQRLEFPNLNWPSVAPKELEKRFDAKFTIINDMQAAQLGAVTFDRGRLTLLKQIVVGDLVGELIIQCSVLNGTPGFAEWLFRETDIGRILISEGMEKSHHCARRYDLRRSDGDRAWRLWG